LPDGFLDKFELIQNLIVPKTNDLEAGIFQRTRSSVIADGSRGAPMSTPINFDNLTCIQTKS
jgi:hypothetical protein